MVGEGDLRLNGLTTGTLVALRGELQRDGGASRSIQGAEERIALMKLTFRAGAPH